MRPEPDRPTATVWSMDALKTRSNPLEEHGPENPDKEPLIIRIEIGYPDKEPSDLDQPKFFELVVSLLVIMLLAVAAGAYQVNEMLEPLFSMVERLVRWMLGG